MPQRPYYRLLGVLRAFEALPGNREEPLPASFLPQYPPPASKDKIGEPPKPASYEGVPRSPFSPRPLPRPLSSSLGPRTPSIPRPRGLSAMRIIPPDQSLEAEDGVPGPRARLSPSRALAGPGSGSAEVAHARDACPFSEAQPQSPPGRPDCTICVPSGEGAKNIWSLVSFPVRTVLVALGFWLKITTQDSPVPHGALACDFGFLVFSYAFPHSLPDVVQPDLRLAPY